MYILHGMRVFIRKFRCEEVVEPECFRARCEERKESCGQMGRTSRVGVKCGRLGELSEACSFRFLLASFHLW